jgi:two-component system invasion response regulator UvrY
LQTGEDGALLQVATLALRLPDVPVSRPIVPGAGVDNIVQAQTLADGFRLYRVQKPDVIIVDLAMRTGALGGLSFIRRLRIHDPRMPVLVFTMHSDPVIVSRALEVGATGYVLKDTSSDEVLKAFQKVREAGPISATTLRRRLPSWRRGEPPIR